MIKGLHHNAYRCRDSEETRGFYEDFLGLRLVSAFEMDDRSCLAFFEVPVKPFDLKRQDTADLHIALGVEPDVFDCSTVCWTRRAPRGSKCADRSITASAARSTCAIPTAKWSS